MIFKVLQLCKNPSWSLVFQKLLDSAQARNTPDNQVTMLILVSSQIHQRGSDSALVTKSNFLSGWRRIWKRILLQEHIFTRLRRLPKLKRKELLRVIFIQEDQVSGFHINFMRKWQYQRRKVLKEAQQAIKVSYFITSGLKPIYKSSWFYIFAIYISQYFYYNFNVQYRSKNQYHFQWISFYFPKW